MINFRHIVGAWLFQATLSYAGLSFVIPPPSQHYGFLTLHTAIPTPRDFVIDALYVKPQRPSVKKKPVSCQKIIAQVEKDYNIPKNLLAAIAKVESRSRPWAVYAQKRGHHFSSKEAAVKFIRTQQAKGVRYMYVGCMQLCIKSHGRHFASIDQVIDPYHNIRYAAKLLRHLYKKHGSWEQAVMYYNSSENKEYYKNKVMRHWKSIV